MNMGARPGYLAAFTLLEVVVAIAIFALSAVVLGAAYLGVIESYQAVSLGHHRNEDLRFARQLLLTEAKLEKAAEGGEFETPDKHRVKWSAEIEPTTMPDLFRVSFSCEVQDAHGTRQHREDFTVLRPTWSDPAERDALRQETERRIRDLTTELSR